MEKNAKIYVTGHRGMVGSAIVRRLQQGGYSRILARTRDELDLLDQRAVHAFLATEKPDYIYIAIQTSHQFFYPTHYTFV